jgi:hypothetical protein
MKGFLKLSGPVCAILLATAFGCGKPRPIAPKRPVPAGSVLVQFNRKVTGPVELTIDGVRIPVDQKIKKGRHLTITGLAAGKHSYFLLSPREAFGPDQGDLVLPADKGIFVFTFSQSFNSVLYGAPAPIPVSEGLPGVRAVLEP